MTGLLLARTCTAPEPPSWGISVPRGQRKPRRNWCQTFSQVVSSGRHISSCRHARRAPWGLRSFPLLFRHAGSRGDAPLVAWDLAQLGQGGFASETAASGEGVCRAPALRRYWQHERHVNGHLGSNRRVRLQAIAGRVTLPCCPSGDEARMRTSRRQR